MRSGSLPKYRSTHSSKVSRLNKPVRKSGCERQLR